ncbi:hypothetical protein RJ639_045841 [Escallonia herrerae]|uniref:J domain-containing protein n=1 Tax=Escallonia herrerae TaxID=1293975 RepID=A0AA88W6D0_9ASTE|nr:hypothetical protein RJ639_045841 [Escallonia herrerae]
MSSRASLLLSILLLLTVLLSMFNLSVSERIPFPCDNGTLSEIKKAYKQLARKYHPDVSRRSARRSVTPERTEEYTKTIIRVQETYETLSDPQTRASYDIDMSKGLHLAFSARKSGQNDQRIVLIIEKSIRP